MFDLRRVLDKLNIHWVDTGSNTSRGYVNIKCPRCGYKDPSHHLSINEITGQYKCFRNSDHWGTNLMPLLTRASGLPRDKVYQALAGYRRSRRPTGIRKLSLSLIENQREKALDGLKLISLNSGPELDYLAERFKLSSSEALELAESAGLLKAPLHDSRLQYRIVFPIIDYISGDLVAYTGRAISNARQPRYYTIGNIEAALYMPEPPAPETKPVVILCEGPFDALQVCRVRQLDKSNLPIIGAAVLGSELTFGKQAVLSDLNCWAGLYCPDSDVPELKRSTTVMKLGQGQVHYDFKLLQLPRGYKDLAEMPLELAHEFLRTAYNSVLNLYN